MMRNLLIAVVLVTTCSAAHAETIAGRAVVIDGDTIDVHSRRIRLLDVDAPESRQLCENSKGEKWRCGQQAALALYDWIGERTVTCETTKMDRYKRILAHCAIGDQDISEWLAENGWAVPYRDCECETIRDAARRATFWRTNIWSGAFEMPWEGRKSKGN